MFFYTAFQQFLYTENSELFCQKVKACTSETAHLQGIKVDNRRRNGEQTGVETVEHAAVAGEDLSAVLDAEVALEETFDQVAPCAENANGESESDPAEGTEGDVGEQLTEGER